LRFKVRIEGADEVVRALNKLPADVKKAMRAEAKDIAVSVADRIKIAGWALGRQGPRVASTVREGTEGFWPVVTASNTGRALGRTPAENGSGLLFGFEFGMKRQTGWYRHRRYWDTGGPQFWPHRGQSSYWFFKTAKENQPWIESEWHKAADQVVREWSA
jgi:hypothetical protein